MISLSDSFKRLVLSNQESKTQRDTFYSPRRQRKRGAERDALLAILIHKISTKNFQ